MQAIEKLAKIAESWGGRVSIVAPHIYKRTVEYANQDNNPWWEAPFTSGHALRWDIKVVMADCTLARPSAIIHEMGHVFADPKDPGDADEFAWFGWEYVLALKVRAVADWYAGNMDYGIGQSIDFGGLSKRSQRDLVREKIEEGRKAGLIRGLEPIPLRRPKQRVSSRSCPPMTYPRMRR